MRSFIKAVIVVEIGLCIALSVSVLVTVYFFMD